VKPFLQYIIDDLGAAESASLKDKCFVFPSRRATVYFTDLLKHKFQDKVFWAPQVLSIEDFILQNTPELVVVDEIGLIFKLFNIYKKEVSHLDFDSFYSWGQTLLKDFDEIDRYLVDANLLYKNLQEVENIEEAFGPGEEVIQAIKGFKEVIITATEGTLAKHFIETWTTVGKVYHRFKEALLSNGEAYNGLCYRMLAEGLQGGNITLAYEEIVFAGFNALSTAEEQIIDSLLDIGQANVYLDADKYYLDDENQEAGYFMRKMQRHWRKNGRVKWVINDGFSHPKSIKLIGVAQKTAQGKAAASCIKETGSQTAIALADESLLMPVLYALPEQDSELNITMGYPVAETAQANLLKAFIKYHASVSVTKQGKEYFSLETYGDLITQPALKFLIPDAMTKLTDSKSRYISWDTIQVGIKEADSENIALLSQLFKPTTDVLRSLETLSRSLLDLSMLTREDDLGGLLREQIISTLVKYLQELENAISELNLKISFTTLEHLINESLQQLSTPFNGEPLANLQIMGFLETRALDFENLVIISANEDILPATGGSKTYIPFGIRKAFKLPTLLEHNNIYAYHFFRSLQRGKNISIIYSTQLSITGSGEKSRFILQLIDRFLGQNTPVTIEQVTSTLPIPIHHQKEALIVNKTGGVLEQLTRHFDAISQDRPLSPTSLVDYLTCSLKYYLARVVGIREPDERSPEIDARVFGNLLHEVLETAYTPFIGKKINKNELKFLIKHDLAGLVNNTFTGYAQENGDVAFTHHVVHYLAKRILRNDLEDTPIKIIDLESRQNPLCYNLPLRDGTTIPLGGKIDRIDQITIDGQEVKRVLDYKTGSFKLGGKLQNRKELATEDYIDVYFNDPQYKSGFQIYFYTLIHHRLFPLQPITGGIISIKNLNRGIAYLRQEKQALAEDIIIEFEKRLLELIEEIRNPNIPFQQTEDSKRCSYCEFKTICNR